MSVEAEKAASVFRELFDKQRERAEKMAAAGKTDFSARPLRIGIAAGDGIGPLIVEQAEAALRLLLKDETEKGDIVFEPIEGLTIENRLRLNQSVPEDTLEQIRRCPVFLKGPTTTPNGGTMTSANVTLRKALDLYANVRPVAVPEKGIDWVFYRENTEGEYALGSLGVEMPDFMAVDFKVITRAGTDRIARAAFEHARKTGRKRVTVVTKANIMKKTDGLFSAVCRQVAAEYPEITCDEYYVDIMAASLIDPALQRGCEVILTPNLYGDILTDEAAQIQGGVGTAGSANMGDRYAMFEAIHGSAPRLIEQGLGDWADPESILQAAVLLLSHIGRREKAELLRGILKAMREEGIRVAKEEGGITCREFGREVLRRISAS